MILLLVFAQDVRGQENFESIPIIQRLGLSSCSSQMHAIRGLFL